MYGVGSAFDTLIPANEWDEDTARERLELNGLSIGTNAPTAGTAMFDGYKLETDSDVLAKALNGPIRRAAFRRQSEMLNWLLAAQF